MEILVSILSVFLPLIPGPILRMFISEERLAAQIDVTISDDRRGVFLNGGDIPYAEINLKVTNLTPFKVTIERLWCEIRFLGGRISNLETTLRQVVQPRTSKHIHLQTTMTAPQRDFVNRVSPADLEKYRADRQLRIGLEGDLSCRVRQVQIFGRELTTANLEVINFQQATPDSE